MGPCRLGNEQPHWKHLRLCKVEVADVRVWHIGFENQPQAAVSLPVPRRESKRVVHADVLQRAQNARTFALSSLGNK